VSEKKSKAQGTKENGIVELITEQNFKYDVSSSDG